MHTWHKTFRQVSLLDGLQPVLPYPVQEKEGRPANTVPFIVEERSRSHSVKVANFVSHIYLN